MNLRCIVLCLVAAASCQRAGNSLPTRSVTPAPSLQPPLNSFKRIAFATIDGEHEVSTATSPTNIYYEPATKPLHCSESVEKCLGYLGVFPDSTRPGLVQEIMDIRSPPTGAAVDGEMISTLNFQFVIAAPEDLDIAVPMLWSSTFDHDCGSPNPSVKPHIGSNDISIRTDWKGIPHRVMTVSHPMAALHVASRIVPQPATAGLPGAAQRLKIETIVFEESSGTKPLITFPGETTRFLADHSCGLPHAPATPFATLEDRGRLYVLFAREELSDETIRFSALDVATGKIVYQWPGGLPNPKF